MTTKLSPVDVGCYVDGHWGQYGGARMIQVAKSFGYDDSDAIAIADKHLASMYPSTTDGLTDDEHDQLMWALDEAESWLNDNVAGEDHYFGWFDGEFFYQSVDWFDEDAQL